MYSKDVSVGRHLASTITKIMDEASQNNCVGTHSHTQEIFLRGLGAVTAAISELEMRMKRMELEMRGESVDEEEVSKIIVP